MVGYRPLKTDLVGCDHPIERRQTQLLLKVLYSFFKSQGHESLQFLAPGQGTWPPNQGTRNLVNSSSTSV